MEDFTHKEFTIEHLKDAKFRVGKISPIDLLAISYQIDLENFKMTKTLLTFVVENVETLIGETWLPVKVKDKEIYQPIGIDKNLPALNDIFIYMTTNVISKVFQPSNE